MNQLFLLIPNVAMILLLTEIAGFKGFVLGIGCVVGGMLQATLND